MQLPEGEGYYRIPPYEELYGDPDTIAVIQETGKVYAKEFPDKPFGVNDISRRGGGPFPPHGGHQAGLEVDIRPPRLDGGTVPVTWKDGNYCRECTVRLAEILKQTGRIDQILFNDPEMVRLKLAVPFPGHDNHLHVRIKP